MSAAGLVFPCLRWSGRDVDEVWAEVRSALDLGVGGFVVFGGSVEGMREVTRLAIEHAQRPLLFSADLERGAGQQFAGASSLPPPAALAATGAEGRRLAARITAEEAVAAGVGWVLAPVADLDVEPANPIVGTRSFGGDPVEVADCVVEWVIALQEGGAHACVKHFPGHGRTVVDSHVSMPAVEVDRETLEEDLLPFRSAVTAGVRSVMLAHVRYPALDDSGTPATLSPRIIDTLRHELGFGGVVATDALIMGALADMGVTEAEAAALAVGAGCDALLCPSSAAPVIEALEAAVTGGSLQGRRVAEAVERVEALAVAAPSPGGGEPPNVRREEALGLAQSALVELEGGRPRVSAGDVVRVDVVDDDLIVPAEIPVPTETRRRGGHLVDGLVSGGCRIVEEGGEAEAHVVAVFCDVRGWKGRSGLAPESLERIRELLAARPDAALLLFAHPRLSADLPADSIVCAWSGEPSMQEAAARYLLGAGGEHPGR